MNFRLHTMNDSINIIELKLRSNMNSLKRSEKNTIYAIKRYTANCILMRPLCIEQKNILL